MVFAAKGGRSIKAISCPCGHRITNGHAHPGAIARPDARWRPRHCWRRDRRTELPASAGRKRYLLAERRSDVGRLPRSHCCARAFSVTEQPERSDPIRQGASPSPQRGGLLPLRREQPFPFLSSGISSKLARRFEDSRFPPPPAAFEGASRRYTRSSVPRMDREHRQLTRWAIERGRLRVRTEQRDLYPDTSCTIQAVEKA